MQDDFYEEPHGTSRRGAGRDKRNQGRARDNWGAAKAPPSSGGRGRNDRWSKQKDNYQGDHLDEKENQFRDAQNRQGPNHAASSGRGGGRGKAKVSGWDDGDFAPAARPYGADYD